MIRLERTGGLLRITLDRQERRNALSLELLSRMREALSPEALAGLSAVIITAAGPVFSAGADLSEVTGTSADIAIDDSIAAVVRAIIDSEIPVIAEIDGPCIGGAVDIALSCDIRIASERARFQVPATRLGLLYNPAAVARMHRLLSRTVLDRLLVLGESFDAYQAFAAGLVTHLAPFGVDSKPAVSAEARQTQNANVDAAVSATRQLLDALDRGEFDLEQWEAMRREILDSPSRAAAVARAKFKRED